MAIKVGDVLPDTDFLVMTDGGPSTRNLHEMLEGRKVVLFGLPGAYTPTCSAAHLPSFMRTAKALAAEGVDEIGCISVNDPHVMRHWGNSSGGTEAGIAFLADADGSYTKAIGMDFTAPPAGFFGRSMRYAMYVEDKVVRVFHVEEQRGMCELSGGENMLDSIKAL